MKEKIIAIGIGLALIGFVFFGVVAFTRSA